MTGKFRARLAALAALALLSPAGAAAQGCIGAAVPDGARAVQALAGAVSYDLAGGTEGTELGVGYRGNPRGPLAYTAEYTFRTVGEADVRMHVLSSALALRLPLRVPLPFRLPALVLCARTGVAGARVAQEASDTEYANLTIPVGVVVELPLPVAPGTTLLPYVAPQYLHSRTSGRTFGVELDENGGGFGVEAGAALRRDRFTVGAGFQGAALPVGLGTPAVPDRLVFVRVGVLF